VTMESHKKPKKKKELTGRHVLFMLIAFFSVTVGVNAIFITKAVSSFSGEDVKGSYRQGLEYNKTIQSRSEQAELGWTVTTNVISSAENAQRFIIRVSNQDDKPIENLTVSGQFNRPTNLANDEAVSFVERGNGIYEAQISLPRGQWRLKASAASQRRSFRFENQFVIS